MERGEVLMLTCPRCSEPFASAMQMDPPTFAAIRVEGITETCPICAHTSRFDKADYGFQPSPSN